MLKSVQREFDDFFQKLNGDEFQLRSITKGALTQARAQLKYQAFIELDQPTQDEFYENGGAYGWDKYRVLAVDGSTIKLPFHSCIVEEFGVNSFAQMPIVLKVWLGFHCYMIHLIVSLWMLR
ncbi:MAG: hypothetical protein NVV82_13640 [Sporocytophaga sp.]|nr:hypothetical protein [Sporocytophaga sp.]